MPAGNTNKDKEKELQQLEQKLIRDVSEITNPENAYVNLYKRRLEDTTRKLSQAYQRIAQLELVRDEIIGLQNNAVIIPDWVKGEKSNEKDILYFYGCTYVYSLHPRYFLSG